jgi:Helix-turn-helix domain
MSGNPSQTTNSLQPGLCDQLLPEFGTVEDTCRIFGLGRTKLYSYIQRGIVRSVCLREPGKATGKRLIHLQSVRAFLLSQMESVNPFGDAQGVDD